MIKEKERIQESRVHANNEKFYQVVVEKAMTVAVVRRNQTEGILDIPNSDKRSQ